MAWETFPCSYTSPQNHSWIFKTLWVIVFWVRVTCKMQPQNNGPGILWGQSYVLPMTWEGWRHMGGPLSVDMEPYGCFISNVNFMIMSSCVTRIILVKSNVMLTSIFFKQKSQESWLRMDESLSHSTPCVNKVNLGLF